jgi:hypothetical protein
MVAVLLAILAALAPCYDMVLFGPHEHVAAATASEAQLRASADPIAPSGPYHCELCASPAERAIAPVVAAPGCFAWTLSDPLAPPPHAPPFALLAPPRA